MCSTNPLCNPEFPSDNPGTFLPPAPLDFPKTGPAPVFLSGSEFTRQLREAADSYARPENLDDLLRTAADVIDRLTRELVDLSSRKPRPVVIQLPTGSGICRHDLMENITTKSGARTHFDPSRLIDPSILPGS